MANKPIHLRMKAKNPCGRQAMWEAIRANKDGFTLTGLANSFSDLKRSTLETYVHSLLKGGYLESSVPQRFKASVFKLIKDVGVNAPRLDKRGKEVTQGAGNEQMWLAMKRLKSFRCQELVGIASTEETLISLATAKTYVETLCRAGYLRRVDAGRYAFIPSKNTGAKAPMIQRLKTVFDPNLQKIVWQQEAGDD